MATKAKSKQTKQAAAAPTAKAEWKPITKERAGEIVDKLMAHALYHQEWPALLCELLNGVLYMPFGGVGAAAVRRAGEIAERKAAAKAMEKPCPVELTPERGAQIADFILHVTQCDEDEIAVFIELTYAIFYSHDRSKVEEAVRVMNHTLYMATMPGERSLDQFIKRQGAKVAKKGGAQ